MRILLEANFKSICEKHNVEYSVDGTQYCVQSIDDIKQFSSASHELIALHKEGFVSDSELKTVTDFSQSILEVNSFPMLHRQSKPEGEGWKTRSVYNAPIGATVEIAAQGLNKKRAIIKGTVIDCWSETIVGIPTKGVTIETNDIDGLVLNSWQEGQFDVEDVRCDWWRVIEGMVSWITK